MSSALPMASDAQRSLPKESRPRTVLVKPVSGDCNLHCTYCFYHDRPSDPYSRASKRKMSDDILSEMVRQMLEGAGPAVTFGWQGGEPTLAGVDFFQRVVELQQEHGYDGQIVSNSLMTNGVLLDPVWIDFFRRYNMLIGISMDGPPDYHDQFRVLGNGRGSFEGVQRGMALLRDGGVEFNVLVVVNRLTGDHPDQLYDYFRESDLRYLQFVPCVERDPSTGAITDWSVRPGQYGDFLCRLFDRWYNDGRPEISIRMFDNLVSMALGQPAECCEMREHCDSYLVVEYNGDCYPCDFFVTDEWRLGNLMDRPLWEIAADDKTRRFALDKATPNAECQSCRWLSICLQGCQRYRDLVPGRRDYICSSLKRFFAHAAPRIATLAAGLNRQQQSRGPVSAPQAPAPQISRNAKCPCGSGRRYKQCCGSKAASPAT